MGRKNSNIEKEPIGKLGKFTGYKFIHTAKGYVNSNEYLFYLNAQNAMIEAIYTGNWKRFNDMLRDRENKKNKTINLEEIRQRMEYMRSKRLLNKDA